MPSPKYYVDGGGNYIGAFEGAHGIDVSSYTEVPSAPDHSLDTWNGASWDDAVVAPDDEFATIEYVDDAVISDSQIFQLSGFIESPSDKTYRVIKKIPYACTVNSITTVCASGTCTLTGKIDSVSLGGTANSVSSAEQEQAHVSTNSVSAGNDIDVTISSNSSCADLAFTIKLTRTMA